MGTKKRRIPVWFALIVMVPALLIAGVMGLFLYMSNTATPLHPDPQQVPSMAQAVPARAWVGAVEQGQHLIRQALHEQNLPGLSVAVGVGDALVWTEGFGWADLEHQLPVAPDTRFRIGTASIALTSAAVGLLVEQDRLRLDDVIQTYVPDYPAHEWPVTVRHLMGHVAGVRNDGGDEGPLFSQHCESPADGVRYIADYPLLFEPGTQYRFSSYGWILISAAIDAVADDSFLTFMRRHIFEPLGMHDTLPELQMESIAGLATPYFPRFAADPRYGPDLMRPINYSCYAGSSMFVSTPSDLVRFAMAVHGGTWLQPATVQLLQTSQPLASGEETGYGLGWQLETVERADTLTRTVGHHGTSLGGMVASLMIFPGDRPERAIVVAVMSNTSYADTRSLAVRIAQLFAQ